MKAVAFQQPLPISSADSLFDVELPEPVASGLDLLVQVEAISVNPVDTKVRSSAAVTEGQYKVLGWDAAGTVVAVGEKVSRFKVGDKVWYAGAIDRPGTNAEKHLVDERIVAKMPSSLSFSAAAAMPLTSITAWELLFDRLCLGRESTGALLILGGAGGVGSMMIQLAKKLTNLTVIATASKAESQAWVRKMGADYVIDHHQTLAPQLKELGFAQVQHIMCLTQTDLHIKAMPDILAPQGSVGLIDDPQQLDIVPFKRKSISFHWELMFTRSLFQTDDMVAQHELLQKVAAMVDKGALVSTLNHDYGTINSENLKRAHQQQESGTTVGKIVLTGF